MRCNGVTWWFIVAVVVATTTEGKEPELHRVGGKRGWTQNVNYTEWARNQSFYVGDWLYFGFDRHIYNVLEVNQTSYQQCNDKGFLKNITRGGRDVYNLTEARQFYFLSSGGYCFHGMKLAVNVVEFVPSPQPVLYENGSPILVAARLDTLGSPDKVYSEFIFFQPQIYQGNSINSVSANRVPINIAISAFTILFFTVFAYACYYVGYRVPK